MAEPRARRSRGRSSILSSASVTSLVDANRAGDPFTKNDSPDPPSLGLEPDDRRSSSSVSREIASLTQFAPVMASPLLPPNAKSGRALARRKPRGKGSRRCEESIRLGQFAETHLGPVFGPATGLTRAKLLRREGGTARSEKSVEDGLDWIVRHQRADGSWSLNFHDQCQAAPCPFQLARTQSDTAATGLGPVAASGCRPYSHGQVPLPRIGPARTRMADRAPERPTATSSSGPPGMAYLYSHAIATMALCEAYGLSA